MDVDLSPIPLSGGKMAYRGKDNGVIAYQEPDGLGGILTVRVY